MKRLFAAAALGVLGLSAAGCIVTSVYPFYSDATAVFEPALLGKWLDSDDKTTWTFEKDGEKAYRVTAIEPKDGKTTEYIVHALRLGDRLYVDAFPARTEGLAIGGHFLARVELHGDSFRIWALDLDALDKVNRTNGSLPHVHRRDDGTITEKPGGPDFAGTVLLAPTSELQAFLKAHGDEVFEKDGGTMKKVIGTDVVNR